MTLTAFVMAGCATPSDKRLDGTFISDKPATLQFLHRTGQYSTEQLDKLGQLFGRLKVTFRDGRVIIELDGVTDSFPLRITDRNATAIVLKTKLMGEPAESTLTFTGDGYWVIPHGTGKPFREKFRKIK